MVKANSIKPVCVLLLLTGCCSIGNQQEVRQSDKDTTTTIQKQRHLQPATLQSNVSTIAAIVKAIIPVDSLNFRLTLSIIRAFAQGETPSFVEAGQEVTVIPHYFLNNAGIIDTTNEGNAKLLGLKNLHPGKMFHGNISLTSTGQWVILEVTNP